MRRALVVAGVALLALLGAAGPASAHNTLISSDPAEGASLDSAPSTITLTFDQDVQQAQVNEVAVTGPDGRQYGEGTVEVNRNVVTSQVQPLGPAGEYVIGFRVLSADGHPVSEEIRFTLTAAGQGTGAPSSPEAGASSGQDTPAQQANQGQDGDSSSGVPVWVWIVAAVVLLLAGVTVALRMGSSSEDK
ncbi:copper resistance CopC family protein [Prauserella cavernicola]|uniref:Copper resistance protein CopC n=1 Tax=Prauserella cavernicola TaxID=2800127 RepID=A0A934QSE4_9PSEU|nr:copper resistance CopC family protein [Prauserella cavernicola]MBK1784484.1 copper resistance protein CopC [Prauserella cavernicola]